jgi:hypothetical protein
MPDSNKIKDYCPTTEDLAAYVDSLKISLKDGEIKDDKVKNVVKSMPLPKTILASMSNEECKLIFETVRWAWKQITGKDLRDLAVIDPPPETLIGNYWMLANGMMFHGVNHYTIIKQNLGMFATLLNISPFVFHDKMSGKAEDIIKIVIDYGAVRIFVTKDKRAYFQMNDQVYSKWGRNKVKKLDFDKKTVILIDKNINYNGWKSGIIILL